MTDLVQSFQICRVIHQYRKTLLLKKEGTGTHVSHKFHLGVPLPFVFNKIKIELLGGHPD